MKYIAGLVLSLCLTTSYAQVWQNNADRDAYIIALANKVNAQTLWIRSAVTILAEIQCGLGEAMVVNKRVAEALQTVPPVPIGVTIGTTSCVDKTKPFPTLEKTP